MEYFHGDVVKQMKLSLLTTKMIQLAGDFITVHVWLMKCNIFIPGAGAHLIQTEHSDG